MIYDISHKTTYEYENPVARSHHLLHLSPRNHERQTVSRHSVLIDPAPTMHADASDYFGNPVSFVTMEEEHRIAAFHARGRVIVSPPTAVQLADSPAWETVAQLLHDPSTTAPIPVVQHAFPSPLTECGPEVAEYARQDFAPGSALLEAVSALTARIHADFFYDSAATDIATPVDDIFALRRGVCQDFAHLQLACLRSLGLAARYVSGYLLTKPPLGSQKLLGADASHAWISVWCPRGGWVDFDPTNNLMPSDQHITLAWGRDFGDVSPVNGVILGGGEHQVTVEVDVVPASEQ